MKRLKVFPTHTAACRWACDEQSASRGGTFKVTEMILMDKGDDPRRDKESYGYTKLGVVQSREDAYRYMGIPWASVDLSAAGPIDGEIAALLLSSARQQNKAQAS